jgi:drug/metabolite transporter (DMT)-like permease
VTLALGLVLAVLSAAAGMVGFLLRHRGAVEAPDVEARHPLRSALALFRSKWWTVGYVVAFGAYVLHVGALSLAALSLVQTVLAGGLVLLGVFAERFFGFHLGPRQWAGMVLAAAGLAVLAATGEARSGQDSADYAVAGILAFEGALAALAVACILAARARAGRASNGLLLGIAAGLLFALSHVAVKALTGRVDVGVTDVVLSPYLPLAALAGVVAFFASARSLQIGPGVPVIALTSIAGNAATIPAGMLVFGDPLGGDPLTVALRVGAFVAVVAAGGLIPAPTRAARASAGERRAAKREAPPPAVVPPRSPMPLVSQTGSLSSDRQR